NLKAKKAVVITDTSSDYGKGLAKNFIATFTAAGGSVVAEEGYVAGDTDFNAVITKIKGQEFDVVFIPGYYQEAGLIIKQARAQGITAPVLGADGFDSPVLKELAGAEALNNVYFSNHYSSLDKDPTVTKFIADFKAKYGKEPDAFNALGYDLAKFAADAIGRAETVTGEGVKNAMAATENFVGVTGSFSVDENHNPVKALVVIGLENGDQATTARVSM
ncbi:MAG: ABC transporter substrate-binding protein, partial [Oscillospiraceae bacterium]